jgi:hypothetical protein
MITVSDIQEWSRPHPVIEGGRMTNIFSPKYEVSIVGGGKKGRLYGDFKNSFEVAVFSTKSREFVTRFFFPDNSDDVVGYLSSDNLEEFLNSVFRENNFQVR